MDEEGNYESLCDRMIEQQIARRGVKDELVLGAMRSVPRHVFVPEQYRYAAYSDGPLPISSGQTISQPYIVALMTDLLELKGGEKLLEIGTGSGYQAAVLAQIAAEVYTIERHSLLAREAETNLKNIGVDNVRVLVGDGSKGLIEFAPFDGIIVTAAAPNAPRSLLEQLNDFKYLVIPVGSRGNQYLERWQRQGETFRTETILAVAFVPLIGAEGWSE